MSTWEGSLFKWSVRDPQCEPRYRDPPAIATFIKIFLYLADYGGFVEVGAGKEDIAFSQVFSILFVGVDLNMKMIIGEVLSGYY